MTPSRAVRLSSAIMTHPGRLDAARALSRTLSELDPVIVVDPAPGTPHSCIRNARRAWAACGPSSTHHLVLQDDALPSRDFVESLRSAIAERPRHAVSLFTEWGSYSSYGVRLAALAETGWAPVIDHYLPSVGLVLPADTARAFGLGNDESVLQDDVALMLLCERTGVPMALTVPNLIQHGGTESLVGNQAMGSRLAAHYKQNETARGTSRGPELAVDIPYFAAELGRARSMLYDPRRRTWFAGSFQDFLDRQGLNPDRMRMAGPSGGRAVSALRACGLSKQSLQVLGGLRLVVYGLAHQAGRFGRFGSSGPSGPGGGLADLSAIRTAAPGALRWSMSADELTTVRHLVDRLLEDCARRGFEDGSARRTSAAAA